MPETKRTVPHRCAACGERFDSVDLLFDHAVHSPECDGECSSGCPVQCGPVYVDGEILLRQRDALEEALRKAAALGCAGNWRRDSTCGGCASCIARAALANLATPPVAKPDWSLHSAAIKKVDMAHKVSLQAVAGTCKPDESHRGEWKFCPYCGKPLEGVPFEEGGEG